MINHIKALMHRYRRVAQVLVAIEIGVLVTIGAWHVVHPRQPVAFGPADLYSDSSKVGYEHDPTYYDNGPKGTFVDDPTPATGGDLYAPVDDPSFYPLPAKPPITCTAVSGDPLACQRQEVTNQNTH